MYESDPLNSSLITCGSQKIGFEKNSARIFSKALIKGSIKPKPHKLK